MQNVQTAFEINKLDILLATFKKWFALDCALLDIVAGVVLPLAVTTLPVTSVQLHVFKLSVALEKRNS